MASSTVKNSHSKELHKEVIVPIYRNDISLFNDEFTCLKQRFKKEMKKVEEEMNILSKKLKKMTKEEKKENKREKLQKSSSSELDIQAPQSPLIVEDSGTKLLKLQFDVSQFNPNEISVRVCKNILLITAIHEEHSKGCTVYNEFKREFALPDNTNPASIRSSITNDGILIVKVPLVQNIVS